MGTAWVIAVGCVGDAANPNDAGGDDATTQDVSQQTDGAPLDAAPPDASDASDAGAFGPASFGSKLVVWLDVSKDVIVAAGKVTTWKDQSGKGNDAVQTVAANAPSLTADAGMLGAVTFNAPTDAAVVPIYLSIADSASLHFGLGDWTVAVVARHTNALGTYGALWTKADEITPGVCPCRGAAIFANSTLPVSETNFLAQAASNGFDAAAYVDSVDGGYNDGKFHVIIARRTQQTTLEIRTDGISAKNTTLPAVDDTADGAAVGIGAGATGYSGVVGTSQLLHGDIAEIVAVQGTVSDTDMGSLEAYFKSKYGL
jgi:hypothetical protein